MYKRSSIMADDSHLPIAVRRTRRSSAGPPKASVSRRQDGIETSGGLPSPRASPTPAVTSTPKKSKKRVRFSDPGPILSNLNDEEPSTGLTPIFKRTSLSSRTKRRHSTPLRVSTTPTSASGICIPPHDAQGSPFSGEVTFLPLRQVLDGRVKRRIRRNGLSEEMNVITAEKKRRAQETKAEIERLKAELAEKDVEIQRLHDETVVIDTERVWELEQQVELLKRQLASQSGVQRQQQFQVPSSPGFGWTVPARDPYSDDFMDLDTHSEADTEAFGDTTMAELVCSTPTRRAQGSFPTPPTTSPPRDFMTPCPKLDLSHAHTGVQATLPDPEKKRLELEMASLHLEISKLTSTLESYSTLTTRLADRLGPYPPDMSYLPDHPADEQSTPNTDLEPRLKTVLQLLSDRTAALSELDSSLTGLGFPGSDAFEVIASISSAFRTARLELEYLTPGEVTLPLTSAGAAVLDLLLVRLRELGKKNKEAEETIDEYHSIELSLRQQLGARVDAMDSLRQNIATLKTQSSAKDSQIADLELGLERLKGAVSRYTRDITELETLVQAMEEDLATANETNSSHEKTIADQTSQLLTKSECLSALEKKLSSAAEQTTSLQSQLLALQESHAQALQDLRQSHKNELSRVNKSHGASLALRDARVSELRLEIDRVNGSLRSAHEMIRQLRVENNKLKGLNDSLTGDNNKLVQKVELERVKAKEVIDGMREELKKVVMISESFCLDEEEDGDGDNSEEKGNLNGECSKDVGVSKPAPRTVVPPTPSGSLLSGELAKKRNSGGSVSSESSGKKRRKYDSGLGFLDEEEG
ncbi:myosin heavy chain, skeletal muscle, adult [Naviculisporaceae sp. PSN 640]